jgi:ribose-phosphate pyrophosphokinase
MRVIDSDDYKASGIETFFFPGGEPHARLPPDAFGPALLFLKPRTWNDIGIAVCVLAALYEQRAPVWLFCPYFPGARQDRTDYRTPVTKFLMAQILGRFVNRLYTFDVHSNTRVGIHIERNYMPADLTRITEYPPPPDAYIIAPDKGATFRAQSLANAARVKTPVIQCEKVRDFATGKFMGFNLPPLPGVGSYLIVDDICDGGGTFNLLAEEFLKDQYGKDSDLALLVSHGIFSKGLDAIHPKIGSIFTTDSWCQLPSGPRLDVISLQPIIDQIVESASV